MAVLAAKGVPQTGEDEQSMESAEARRRSRPKRHNLPLPIPAENSPASSAGTVCACRRNAPRQNTDMQVFGASINTVRPDFSANFRNVRYPICTTMHNVAGLVRMKYTRGNSECRNIYVAISLYNKRNVSTFIRRHKAKTLRRLFLPEITRSERIVNDLEFGHIT